MSLNNMLKIERHCRVVIVQADHEESLKAMYKARKEGLADFILIGDKEVIYRRLDELKIQLDGLDIRNADNDEEASELAAGMAATGEADVIMKGLIHTAPFIKALLNKERNLISPGALISHIGLFEIPGLPHPFLLTDAAINIAPDWSQKSIILENALRVSRSLGIDIPKAICIAPVEKANRKIQSTIDAEELVKRGFDNAIVEGPMAMDVALSRKAADIKGIESRAAGQPDILLLPDINSANAVYKVFAFIPGSESAGILAGFKVPVVLTSRSESDLTRFLSLKFALACSGV